MWGFVVRLWVRTKKCIQWISFVFNLSFSNNSNFSADKETSTLRKFIRLKCWNWGNCWNLLLWNCQNLVIFSNKWNYLRKKFWQRKSSFVLIHGHSLIWGKLTRWNLNSFCELLLTELFKSSVVGFLSEGIRSHSNFNHSSQEARIFYSFKKD